jgi:hypothetical protein
MGQLSPILRSVDWGGRPALSFWCPGCDESHVVTIKRPGDERGWEWNCSITKPTFTPSILVTSGHYMPNWQGPGCYCDKKDEDDQWFSCSRCHSYVTDGKIQFLDDCTHDLKGQTVDLPEWDFEE